MKPGHPHREDDDASAPSGFQPTQFLAPDAAPLLQSAHAAAPLQTAMTPPGAPSTLPTRPTPPTPPTPAAGGSTADVLTDLDPLPDATPADAQATAAKPTLSHIGRYALKQRIAVGGLGAVYEAWDPLLSRTVAVKTLQFDIDTPARVSLDGLFLNEARTAASLDHRGIVTVHDAGLSAHGVYIAMERLVGRDLRDALAQGWRPSPSRAALLARRVAEALAYAHSRGVVHCDIKPANIFLTARLRPKVLDFGIARAVGAGTSALEGLVAGSPHYLAPEQMRGGEVNERTDVYALGVVLYELLAGRKAFDGESLEAITQAVLGAEVPAANAVRPEVPATLAAIAETAMARDPAERFASATAMAHALRLWLGEKIPPLSLPPLAASGLGEENTTPMLAPAADAASAGAAPTAPATVPTPDIASPGAPPGITATRRRPLPRWFAGVAGLVALILAGVIATRNDPRALPPGADTRPAARAAVDAAPVTNTSEAASPSNFGTAPTPHGEEAGMATVARNTDAAAAAVAASANKPAAGRGAARPALKPTPAVAAATVPAPPAQGTVRFAITPWGHIDVDGTSVGTTPPMTTLLLPVGERQVVVRNDGAPPFTTTIVVDAERPVVVRHRFAP